MWVDFTALRKRPRGKKSLPGLAVVKSSRGQMSLHSVALGVQSAESPFPIAENSEGMIRCVSGSVRNMGLEYRASYIIPALSQGSKNTFLKVQSSPDPTNQPTRSSNHP